MFTKGEWASKILLLSERSQAGMEKRKSLYRGGFFKYHNILKAKERKYQY